MQPFRDALFDVAHWYPAYRRCLNYFLDHAQYQEPVQAIAAWANIRLPFQRAVCIQYILDQ